MTQSRLYNFLNIQYRTGRVDEAFLAGQVSRSRLTEGEYEEITGQAYSE